MKSLPLTKDFTLNLSDGASAVSVLARYEHPQHQELVNLLAAQGANTLLEQQVMLLQAAWAAYPNFDLSILTDDEPTDLASALQDPPPGRKDARWRLEYDQRVFTRRAAPLALWLYLDKHRLPQDELLYMALPYLWKSGTTDFPTWTEVIDAAQRLDSDNRPRSEICELYARIAPFHDTPSGGAVDMDTSVRLPNPRTLLDLVQNGLFPRSEQTIEIDWRGKAVSGCKYQCPSVRIQLNNARTVIESIDVLFDTKAPTTHRPGDGAAWDYAQHAARVSLLLEGQLRGHLGRGHLVTEVYRRAFDRVWPPEAGFPQHPFARLLHPFLPTVKEIDDLGVPLVFGPGSIIAETSGLSRASIDAILDDAIDTSTWRAWTAPTGTLSRFERAATAFMRGTNRFIDAWFLEHNFKLGEGIADVAKFTTALDGVRTDGVVNRPWHSPGVGPVTTEGELKQLARHLIFHAAFFHTWANDQQWEVGGDPGRASFALLANEPPQPGETYADWSKRAAPRVHDGMLQCLLADVLAHTTYGRWRDVRGGGDYGAAIVQQDFDVLTRFFASLDPERTVLETEGFPLDDLRAWVAI